jgi:hypothetical protein
VKFFFQILDEEGSLVETSGEFATVENAKIEARRALAESAMDGIPGPPLNMYSVELFDEERHAIIEYRLLYEEVAK